MADRAVIFIDGSNWYHSIKGIRVREPGALDYAKIAKKLVGPREWIATRYYIGQAQYGKQYADQRRFLAGLEASDKRISVHLGRLEPRPIKDSSAKEIVRYLSNLTIKIDRGVYADLMQIAKQHANAKVLIEKAVDVSIAVDMVVMAERDEYDAAYLLSADGDFTPAVDAVQYHHKKVYGVSPSSGRKLSLAVDSYIHLPRDWFMDCYR